MRERAQEHGALTVVRQHRGDRHRRRGRAGPRGAHRSRRHRDRDGRRSPAASGARGSRGWRAAIPLTPAVHQMIDIGPVPALREREERDLVPDRARHGHVHATSARTGGPGGRLLRPPADPARPRGHPLRSRRPRCRPPSSPSPKTTSSSRWSRPRADARDRRRRRCRDQVRDQRPALADARRAADAR